MKKLITLAILAALSTTAVAESDVKKTIIVNKSNNTLTNTQAQGIGNTANTGSINIE